MAHSNLLLVAGFLLAFPAAGLAAERWAVVTATGVLARDSGAQSSTRTAEGSYIVVFNSRIDGCTYQATVGTSIPPRLPSGRPVGGMVGVAPDISSNKAVRVVTRDRFGAPKSKGFHLLVACPPARSTAESTQDAAVTDPASPRLKNVDRWAVVAYDLILASRGVESVAVIPPDTGNNGTEVLFDKEVRLCAYLASQDISSGNNSPFLLGVGPRRGKSDGVHVSSALTSTAGPAGDFHLVVKCPGGRATTPADRWAVVNANGTLVRGFGARGSVKLNDGKGRYLVQIHQRGFGWPAAGRAVLVTVGTASIFAQPPTGVASLEGWYEEDRLIGFVVQTSKPDPEDPGHVTRADLPFHLYVVGY